MANHTICSVDGCGKKVLGRGWCSTHYNRWRKHGDVQPDKPINPSTPRGEVQDYFLNKVIPYEGNECLIWPYGTVLDGYPNIRWNGKTARATRILCEMVNGPAPEGSYHAAHSCGNGMKGCITKRHLSWKTEAENQAEKFIHGTVLRGEKNPPAILTEEQVLEIASLRDHRTYRQLSEMFGVSNSAIWNILSGRKWSWLTGIKKRA